MLPLPTSLLVTSGIYVNWNFLRFSLHLYLGHQSFFSKTLTVCQYTATENPMVFYPPRGDSRRMFRCVAQNHRSSDTARSLVGNFEKMLVSPWRILAELSLTRLSSTPNIWLKPKNVVLPIRLVCTPYVAAFSSGDFQLLICAYAFVGLPSTMNFVQTKEWC